jgi:hypothetical protein
MMPLKSRFLPKKDVLYCFAFLTHRSVTLKRYFSETLKVGMVSADQARLGIPTMMAINDLSGQILFYIVYAHHRSVTLKRHFKHLDLLVSR